MNQPRPHRSADVFPGSDTSWNRTPVAVTGAFLAKAVPANLREFQWVPALPESAAAGQMRNYSHRSSALASDAELFRQKNGANCCSLSGIDDYNHGQGEETCFLSDRLRTEDAVESCSGSQMRRNRGGECLPQRHKFLRKFVYFTGARRCWTKMDGVAEFAGPRRFGSETWPRPGSGVVSPG